jgi:hypothetical protein
MTEEEWHAGRNPAEMLEELRTAPGGKSSWFGRLFDSRRLSPRKLELLSAAWSRCFGDLLDDATRQLFDEAADNADRGEWSFDQNQLQSLFDRRARHDGADRMAIEQLTMLFCVGPQDLSIGEDFDARLRDDLAHLIRDIFGSPFHAVEFDPSWRTANVMDLAKTVYEEEVFDRMPILADALLDAGCGDETILKHCRSGGPHVRGCWVVDQVLGKS